MIVKRIFVPLMIIHASLCHIRKRRVNSEKYADFGEQGSYTSIRH